MWIWKPKFDKLLDKSNKNQENYDSDGGDDDDSDSARRKPRPRKNTNSKEIKKLKVGMMTIDHHRHKGWE